MQDERISFIGTGRVGRVLARLLHDHGYRIETVIDLDPGRAQDCRDECYAQESASDIGKLSPHTSILFITVPDDEIHKAAEAIAGQSHLESGTVIAHTSGLLPSSILTPMPSGEMFLNSMHPCFSFTQGYGESLEGVYFALEGHPTGMRRLEPLIRTLGGRPFSIDPDEKPFYHAACTIASNYLISLLACAMDVMDGLDVEDIIDCLMPLIQSTLSNIRQKGVDAALTGPIARGDTGTVKKHLASLKRRNPELISPYVVLGKRALQIAGGMDTDPLKLEAIQAVFNQYQSRV